MPIKQKQSFHHGSLKPALIDAAIEMLDLEGPDGITIRGVARLAGVSHAAPVNHYKDLRALLTAVAVRLFAEYRGRIANKLAQRGALHEDLAAFAHALIDYGLAHPNRYRMLWRRDLVNAEDANLEAARNVIYDELIDILTTAHQPAQPFDADTYAVGLWSLAHGYVSLRLDGNFQAADDTVSGQPRANAIIEGFLEPFKRIA